MQTEPAKRNFFASAGAVLTVGAMALFFRFYEPWLPIGPDRIADPGFETGAATNQWSGWSEQSRLVRDGGWNGTQGVVLTVQSDHKGVLRFTTTDLEGVPAFRASVHAAASGIVPGKAGYHVPRAVFFYHDAQAKSLFKLRHGIMDISRDKGWKRYTGFFPVPEGAANARLHIQNLGAAGVMQVDHVSVIPVRPDPAARWWKLFFGTLWTISFTFCLSALRPWQRRCGRAILLTAALILIAVTAPGDLLDGAIRKTGHVSKTLFLKNPSPERLVPPRAEKPATETGKPERAARKPVLTPAEPPVKMSGTGVDQAHLVGHMILFSLLAFLASLSWLPARPSLRQVVRLFAGLMLFAAATETLQFLTPDRAAGWKDLFADCAGIASVMGLTWGLRSASRESWHPHREKALSGTDDKIRPGKN